MIFSQRLSRIIDWFYIPPFNRLMPIQTFRYAVCGGANLVMSWVLYFLIYNYVFHQQIVHLPLIAISAHVAALLIVFVVTTLTGFWLQRHISFKASPLRGHVQLVRYLLSTGGSLILNYFILKLFVDGCGFFATPSQIFTSLIITVYSFLMQKYFTFRGCSDQ